jgi:tetratricopeptide (TPR) repeat protein
MYVEAHLLRGRQHLKAKRYAEARQDFLAALEYPEHFETGRPLHGGAKTAEIQYLLGLTSEALGQPVEARRHFEQAVAASPEALPIRYYHALAQRKLGDEASAQKTLDDLIRAGGETLESVKRGPRTDFFGIFGSSQLPNLQAAEAHYLIGLGNLGKGRPDEAQTEFEQAVKLNPNHLGAKTQLAALRDR